jgi:LA2681-like HEPN
VWKDKAGPKGILIPRFTNSKNSMLCGLYWISRDLFDPSFSQSTSPDARALADIRNHIEHKYLKVHEIFRGKAGIHQKDANDFLVDTLAYSISRSDLEDKALRLLKLSRAAITHLTLEEKRRNRARRSTKPLFDQELPIVDHQWKV